MTTFGWFAWCNVRPKLILQANRSPMAGLWFAMGWPCLAADGRAGGDCVGLGVMAFMLESNDDAS